MSFSTQNLVESKRKRMAYSTSANVRRVSHASTVHLSRRRQASELFAYEKVIEGNKMLVANFFFLAFIYFLNFFIIVAKRFFFIVPRHLRNALFKIHFEKSAPNTRAAVELVHAAYQTVRRSPAESAERVV